MDVTSLHIRTMVATGAPMYPFLWGGVGEDTATATDITADIAMEGIRDGIVGDIRGGIGKRTLALRLIGGYRHERYPIFISSSGR